jgi:hypothetical protein
MQDHAVSAARRFGRARWCVLDTDIVEKRRRLAPPSIAIEKTA